MKNGTPATELVYIHSKLLIVDDKTVLIGSANVNDRSMMGSRDSELAVVIQDKTEVSTVMNGKPYQAAAFAHNFRKKVFKSLFGFTNDEEVLDPLNPQMWEEIENRKQVNFGH